MPFTKGARKTLKYSSVCVSPISLEECKRTLKITDKADSKLLGGG